MDRYLILENNMRFKGGSLGAAGSAVCEIVFATGMTGYMETLTDKSYFGQGVVQTFPLIGNYGIIPQDCEGPKPFVSAYIVRECCDAPSNFRCGGLLDRYLAENGIVGISGIDTRALTKVIRETGVMNGMITDDPSLCSLEALRGYRISGAVAAVSVKKPEFHAAENGLYTVALMDYGYKANILRSLLSRRCSVWIMPHDASAHDVAALKPDGIMLSNGPGDPAENTGCIETLRTLMTFGIPMFGICLGHQLMALASGFTTSKMKYGHRGANQAVKRTCDGRLFITSQNHGYAVDAAACPADAARISYINVNDGTCEGVDYLHSPAFSVQFHPEAHAGPQDTGFLFDRFVNMMKEGK